MLPARVWAIAAVTLSVHAVLLATAWRAPPDRRPSHAKSVTLRLVQDPAPRQAVAAAAAAAPASRRRTARVLPDAPVPRRAEPVPAALPAAAPVPVTAPAEVITGVAFGMPRIGLPGAATARWMSPPVAQDVAAAPTPAMLLAQMARERAMREAARAQIADAVQRTLIDTSHSAVEGSCALAIGADARLVCDDESLAQALASSEDALSGLLHAYRRTEPRASGVAIVVAQGRYQVSWNFHDDVAGVGIGERSNGPQR